MHRSKIVAIATLLITALFAQQPEMGEPPDVRLPNGKLQREEAMKAEYKKAIEDAGKLAKAAEELRDDLEKGEGHVLSIASLKKTEEIEKLARRIRDRLKRY